MFRKRMIFSIQNKIILLVVLILSISLICYLAVGRTLFIDDKTSYIFDYSLQKTKATSQHIDSDISNLTSSLNLAVSLYGQGKLPASSFTNYISFSGTDDSKFGSLILRVKDQDHFEIADEVSTSVQNSESRLRKFFTDFNLKPSDFGRARVLVKHAENGIILIAGLVIIPGELSAKFGYLTAIKAPSSWLESELGPDTYAVIVDPTKQIVISKGAEGLSIAPESINQLVEILGLGSFKVGSREWNVGNESYIAGYQYLFDSQLLLVTVIKKSVAFLAADLLVQKSVFLGFSILLISIGFSVFLSRGLTQRLRQMWDATKKVAEGDFSMRVAVANEEIVGDEILGLARSFNTMSEKITELMAATAQKARMEKELETAKTVQKLFFPEKGLNVENVSLVGKCLAASECSGDWWHYSQYDDKIFVILGDVTGHGVSAALITASAHSVFSLFMENLKKGVVQHSSNKQVLLQLARSLDSAIAASGGGQSTMTFILACLNIKNGTLELLNGEHRPPYHCKGEPGKLALSPITGGRCASLGSRNFPENLEVLSISIQPGETVLFYTDGLVEGPIQKSPNYSKTGFLKTLAEIVDSCSKAPDEIANKVLNLATSKSQELEDDITVVAVSRSKEVSKTTSAA